MIKANELRIGNYIYSSITQKYIKVHSRFFRLIESEIRVKGNSTYVGIPLTEELLLKCGFINEFEDEEDNSYFTLKNIEIQKILFKEEFFLDNVNNIGVSIKHLHQLQNLYFVLTGTELEIKL